MQGTLRTSIVAFLGCATLLCGASYGQQRPVAIKIYAFGALTGPVSSFGINSRAALLAAARRIDETGGVRLADGSIGRFDIAYADDHCKPDDAIALLREAAGSDAIAAIGPSCSSVAEPLYGTLQHKVADPSDTGLRIPIFTDGATKADLARISEWAFRNAPNESDMYEALWQWVHARYPELHTLYAGEESDFAHSHSTLQNIILKEAAHSGLQVLGATGWSINDESYVAPVQAIKRANADIVVISAHAQTTCGVLKQLALENVHPKLLVGLTSASTPETLRRCGPAAEGLLIPTSFIANTAETRKEAEAVSAAGGIADLHSMAAWEILYALKLAIEQSGIVPTSQSVSVDRERLRAALAELHSMPGVMGTISRTADRESRKPFVLVRARHGAWEVVPSAAPAPGAAKTSMAEEDFLVPFEASGLRLFLRHLPAAGAAAAGAEGPVRSVLLVHGATFPSALAAAFPFGGQSWMQHLSAADFDVWALDFMGYGGSDRYAQMSDANASGTALLRAEEASRQIETATRFIAGKQHVSRVSVIAHSWGTLPAGIFATRQPGLLDRLVLFGPVALRHEPPERTATDKIPPAWNVTIDAQRARFYGYVPSGERPVLAEPDMKLWGPAYLASDPDSSRRTPPSVRVPYGPLADIDLAWSGTYPYDPAKISAPTLIIRGEWDNVTTNEDAHWLYSRLRNASIRRDVIVSRGTHVMHLEESRFQLYREVQTFLEGNDSDPGLLGSRLQVAPR
jgi:branched-chain amino acid transport system substrate-binding protein